MEYEPIINFDPKTIPKHVRNDALDVARHMNALSKQMGNGKLRSPVIFIPLYGFLPPCQIKDVGGVIYTCFEGEEPYASRDMDTTLLRIWKRLVTVLMQEDHII